MLDLSDFRRIQHFRHTELSRQSAKPNKLRAVAAVGVVAFGLIIAPGAPLGVSTSSWVARRFRVIG
jgi:hypothetical protein